MTIPTAGEPRQPKQLLQNDPFSQPGYTDNFYDAVGGHDTFVKLVDVFYDGVATDPLLRPMYPEEDLGPAKRRFLMFLEQYWGGPTTYGEERGHPRLRMRHMPFRVTPEAKERWLHHMRTAVDSLDLPPAVRGDALGLHGAGRPLHGEQPVRSLSTSSAVPAVPATGVQRRPCPAASAARPLPAACTRNAITRNATRTCAVVASAAGQPPSSVGSRKS